MTTASASMDLSGTKTTSVGELFSAAVKLTGSKNSTVDIIVVHADKLNSILTLESLVKISVMLVSNSFGASLNSK